MAMTMGEFRELTADIPDHWPVQLDVTDGDVTTFWQADASVDLTNRCVVIAND